MPPSKLHDNGIQRGTNPISMIVCALLQVAELERMRRQEEMHLKALVKDTQDLQKDVFRKAQVLADLKRKEKEAQGEISGGWLGVRLDL